MRRTTLIIIALTVVHTVFAQRAKENGHGASLLYEQAWWYMREAQNEFGSYIDAWPKDPAKDSAMLAAQRVVNYRKALETFDELLTKYPRSRLCPTVKVTKSRLKLFDGDTAAAVSLLTSVMHCHRSYYQNVAAEQLAYLSLTRCQYSEALRYKRESQKYKVHRFCGVYSTEEAIEWPIFYAACYRGLHDDDSALAHLLPQVVGDPLTDHSRLVDTAYLLLVKKYDRNVLRLKLEYAFKNYTTVVYKSGKEEYRSYYIDFLGHHIRLYLWGLSLTEPDYSQADGLIRAMSAESYLHQLLSR